MNINEALFQVITMPKKNCPDAHKLVKSYGFKLEHLGKSWRVICPKTKVFVEYMPNSYRYSYYRHLLCIHKPDQGWCRVKGNSLHDLKRVDLYNALTKVRYPRPQEDSMTAKHRNSKDNLLVARHSVEYHTDEIAYLEKTIENLLTRIEEHKADLQKAEDRLANLRRELGLIK